MKGRKALSALLFGVGCAATFIGFLAMILPGVQNAQLQLVLSSFTAPSAQGAARWIGALVGYVLQNTWYVLLFGILCMLIGGALFGHFDSPMPESKKPGESRKPPEKSHAAAPGNPFAVPKPYDPPLPAREAPPVFQPHFSPLLEENRIEASEMEPSAEAPAPALEIEPLPSIPQSFSFESKAIEVDTSEPSPSGSCMILRRPALEEKPPVLDSVPEKAPEKEVLPAPVPPRSRIRSTMGRHQMR